ncbi:uncharacterized protein VTP21DRAFT_8977 [Calcarisporiella thermophila]|uniref:uncharacterized protein n=1 Tax=Calcarisporiella thermophila TaxID=911321 RepID=UPI00374366DB
MSEIDEDKIRAKADSGSDDGMQAEKLGVSTTEQAGAGNLSRSQRILRRLFSRKSMERLREDAGEHTNVLRRDLSAFDLTFVGIGAIIGTGIFVLSGVAAAANAGPAIIVSFVIAAVASGLAAMSYSELASMIPVAGSAYTYSYATLGEFIAWIIGWDLMVEYLFGAAAVSVGWSHYFVSFLQVCGAQVDERFTSPPVIWDEANLAFRVSGAYLNLPGILVVFGLTVILMLGIRESKFTNNIIVAIKVFVVVLFILAAAKFVDTSNLQPFVPENKGDDWRHFDSPLTLRIGVSGIFAGAQTVFFAYIGFDAVTTAAQEAKRPQRDLPIGIILSLVICTVLYIVTAFVMNGVVPYYKYLDDPSPIATATRATGMTWLTIIVSLGAIFGLTSVMLIMLLGQTRVFYAMAHDGLLPSPFARVHPKFRTPWLPTIVCGVVSALLGGFLPVTLLSNMTSVGTLLAFLLVHIGIIILRFTCPDVPRAFKIPGAYGIWMLFPILGVAVSLVLIVIADRATLYRVAIWLGIGVIVYGFYGYHHSRIHNPEHDQKLHDIDSQVRPAL